MLPHLPEHVRYCTDTLIQPDQAVHGFQLPLPLALVLALAAPGAVAQAAVPADDGDDWRFTLNFPMLWAPDISGEIDVDGQVTDIEIPFGDILDKLSMGFIGEFYLEKGNWGAEFRLMYLQTESDSTVPAVGLPGLPPLLGKHKVTTDSVLYTADLTGSYRIHRNVRLYAGIRRTGTEIDMRIKPLEDGITEIKGKTTIADEHLLDWLAGVTLDFKLSENWSTVIQVDAAVAGDNDTDRQLNAFFSYRINHLHNVWFGYRYLEIGNEESSGNTRVETSFKQQGPTLGWAFTF